MIIEISDKLECIDCHFEVSILIICVSALIQSLKCDMSILQITGRTITFNLFLFIFWILGAQASSKYAGEFDQCFLSAPVVFDTVLINM